MSDWLDLYPAVTSLTATTTSPYQSSVSGIDLRQEFEDLIYGRAGQDPIGQTFIFRRMRRDSDGELVPCICVSDITYEPDRDFPCPYCGGNGYLWDEELVTGYKTVAAAPGGSNAASNLPKTIVGLMEVPAVRFFLSYDVEPTREDRIVQVELDLAGDPTIPYVRIAYHELMLVRAMRGKDAEVAYWICSGQKMGPETQGAVS